MIHLFGYNVPFMVVVVAGAFVLLGAFRLFRSGPPTMWFRPSGVPLPTPPAKAHDYHAQAGNDAQRRALALGAVYAAMGSGLDGAKSGFEDPGAFERLNDDTTLSQNEIKAQYTLLREFWGVVDSASFMSVILDLKAGYARAQYEQLLKLLVDNNLTSANNGDLKTLAKRAEAMPEIPEPDDDGPSIFEQLQLVRDNWRKLDDAGTAAWDMARFVNCINMGHAVGYLDNGQAWSLLTDIEMQSRLLFQTWEQFGASFLVGREMQFGSRGEFDEIVKRLLSDSKSPWNTLKLAYEGPEPQASPA